MRRLSIAVCVLLVANLLTEGFKALWLAGVLANLGGLAIVTIGILLLTYFSTLQASPWFAYFADEMQVYMGAAVIGIVLGVFL